MTPISRVFGLDRGQAIDRYYIEGFLDRNSADVRGRVLEVADATYTSRYGGDRVTRSDVLHVADGNPRATIVGDLVSGEGIPVAAFDCLILTQVLPFLSDPRQAVAHSWRSLAPGGVVLATFPGISQISRYDMDRWGDYWRFTDLSARRLFEDRFGTGSVTVETHGNVLAAAALLYGLAADELGRDELDVVDADYQVVVAVRAVRLPTGT